jgi:hypothetical protein
MEQVLGIEPTAGGFDEVSIRPDLAGLQWARGAEPTPRGPIRVSIEVHTIRVTLPPETIATLSLPFTGAIFQNGKPVRTIPAESGTRAILTLREPGSYTFSVKEGSNL